MVQEEEWEQLQAERNAWREIAHENHREVQRLQQEKQVIRDALKEAIQAIERLDEPGQGPMPDIFKLAAQDMAWLYRQVRIFALQCLDTSQLIHADRAFPCLARSAALA